MRDDCCSASLRLRKNGKAHGLPMMTQVEFRPQKLPAYEGEEDGINPGVWGKRLVEYLSEHLSARGIDARGLRGEDCLGAGVPARAVWVRRRYAARSAGPGRW